MLSLQAQVVFVFTQSRKWALIRWKPEGLYTVLNDNIQEQRVWPEMWEQFAKLLDITDIHVLNNTMEM